MTKGRVSKLPANLLSDAPHRYQLVDGMSGKLAAHYRDDLLHARSICPGSRSHSDALSLVGASRPSIHPRANSPTLVEISCEQTDMPNGKFNPNSWTEFATALKPVRHTLPIFEKHYWDNKAKTYKSLAQGPGKGKQGKDGFNCFA